VARRRSGRRRFPAFVPRPAASGFGEFRLPPAGLHFDGSARFQQMMGLCRFFFHSIVREPVFLRSPSSLVVNVSLDMERRRLYGSDLAGDAELIGYLKWRPVPVHDSADDYFAGGDWCGRAPIARRRCDDALPVPNSSCSAKLLVSWARWCVAAGPMLATRRCDIQRVSPLRVSAVLQALLGVCADRHHFELHGLALLVHTW